MRWQKNKIKHEKRCYIVATNSAQFIPYVSLSIVHWPRLFAECLNQCDFFTSWPRDFFPAEEYLWQFVTWYFPERWLITVVFFLIYVFRKYCSRMCRIYIFVFSSDLMPFHVILSHTKRDNSILNWMTVWLLLHKTCYALQTNSTCYIYIYRLNIPRKIVI